MSFNQRCTVCGHLAYVGLKEVECSNPNCRHWYIPNGMQWIMLDDEEDIPVED